MDKVKYVNRFGEVLDMRSREIMSSYLALKNFTHSIENGKLVGQGKSVKLPVVCATRDDANRLINLMEKDSLQNVFGKLYINDWYIKVLYQGLTIISEHVEKIKVEITFYVENSVYSKETSYTISPETIAQGTNGINFPFTYPFNFSTDALAMSQVANDEMMDADFELQISSPLPSISISIDANLYQIDAELKENETFVLNTANKEVYKISNGEKTNLFGAASDYYYIFSPLSMGTHRITWQGEHTMLFKVIEHRRMPTWM